LCKDDAPGRAAVREWLQAGGDINAPLAEAPVGWTLLMGATVYEQRLLVVELLQRGASTELRQSQGSTALALATMKGSRAVVELLLQAAADVNATDNMGLTPFMCAVAKGHKPICELLLRHGARTVARTGDKLTRAAPVLRGRDGDQVWGLQMSRRHTPTASISTSADEGSAVTTPRPGDKEDAEELAAHLIRAEEAEQRQQREQRARRAHTATPASSNSRGRRGKGKASRAQTARF